MPSAAAWCSCRPATAPCGSIPRYDTEPSAIDEALSILRLAIEDLVAGRVAVGHRGDAQGPRRHARDSARHHRNRRSHTGQLSRAASCRFSRWSRSATAPRRRRRLTRRKPVTGSLLQLPLETLEATVANPRAIGIALRDRVSGRFVAYALGSALENHDDEGVSADPRFGENNTFYLQAMATSPTVQNSVDLENYLLDSLRERAIAAGFDFLSTLIEDRLRETGPAWFRSATVLERIENYLHSGARFAYLQVALKPGADPDACSAGQSLNERRGRRPRPESQSKSSRGLVYLADGCRTGRSKEGTCAIQRIVNRRRSCVRSVQAGRRGRHRCTRGRRCGLAQRQRGVSRMPVEWELQRQIEPAGLFRGGRRGARHHGVRREGNCGVGLARRRQPPHREHLEEERALRQERRRCTSGPSTIAVRSRGIVISTTRRPSLRPGAASRLRTTG